MNVEIESCWLVYDVWGLSVEGVYTCEETAVAVARAKLNADYSNNARDLAGFDRALAGMVWRCPLFRFGMGGE